jgi:hypothetical protein
LITGRTFTVHRLTVDYYRDVHDPIDYTKVVDTPGDGA